MLSRFFLFLKHSVVEVLCSCTTPSLSYAILKLLNSCAALSKESSILEILMEPETKVYKPDIIWLNKFLPKVQIIMVT